MLWVAVGSGAEASQAACRFSVRHLPPQTRGLRNVLIAQTTALFGPAESRPCRRRTPLASKPGGKDPCPSGGAVHPAPGSDGFRSGGITTVRHCWVLALRPEGSPSCRPRGESGSLRLRALPPRAAPAALAHAGPLGSLQVSSAPKLR